MGSLFVWLIARGALLRAAARAASRQLPQSGGVLAGLGELAAVGDDDGLGGLAGGGADGLDRLDDLHALGDLRRHAAEVEGHAVGTGAGRARRTGGRAGRAGAAP